MKTSVKLNIAASVLFLIFAYLFLGAFKKGSMTFIEFFSILVSVSGILILGTYSTVMAIRETYMANTGNEAGLILAASGETIQVVSSVVLPTIPWFVGGNLFANANVIAVVTCMWSSHEKQTSTMFRLVRTRENVLPIIDDAGKAFIRVPKAI